MYRIVDPLDDHTPHGVIDGSEVVFVTPVNIGHPMEIRWFLDDVDLNLDGITELDVSTLSLPKGSYTLEVTVVDPTDWVRDEVERNNIFK